VDTAPVGGSEKDITPVGGSDKSQCLCKDPVLF